MRVLQLNHFFYPGEFGGVARVAYDISKELAKRGHEVTVYTTNALDPESNFETKSQEYILHGFKVRYFKNILRPDRLYVSPSIISALRKDMKDFDVVHLHSWRQFQDIFASCYARKYAVPYVFQAHSGLAGVGRGRKSKIFVDMVFGQRLLSRFLHNASGAIALSETEAKQYLNFGVPAEKIVTIPNGIDPSDYHNLPEKGLFKAKYGLEDYEKVILYLGRIHESKGIGLLIKAHAYLIKSMKLNDSTLVIAGPNDGYLKQARSLVRSLDIEQNVTFAGFVSDADKIKALVDADIFVTPSFYGFPVTFLEACVVGLPIVTTTLGETLDWINNNVGYTVPPTPRDLAGAIYKLLRNENVHRIFSERCKNVANHEFSIHNVVDNLESLYQSLIEPSQVLELSKG